MTRIKNNLVRLCAVFAACLAGSQVANAGPIDLSSWGNEGNGRWTLQQNNNAVVQSINGQPTVFFENGSNDRGKQLSGQIRVQTTGDDDFIGFVLGYQAGELRSANADFWLLDWKQNNQGSASRGLSLSHVTNGVTSNFWNHSGGVREVARGDNFGNTGWRDFATYDFDIVFTESLLQVYINDVLELDITAAAAGVSEFTDGAFGFYNYSQSQVSYAGIRTEVASVPEPETLVLFAVGLMGLGLARRKTAR